MQLLLGHTELESTVRYLGIEVDDALEISEQTEVLGLIGIVGWRRTRPPTGHERPASTTQNFSLGRSLGAAAL